MALSRPSYLSMLTLSIVRHSPVLLVALVLLLAACDSEGSSLYDPDAGTGAAPSIASVSPGGVILAGVDAVTIEGQNFSATPTDNVVVFEDGLGNSDRGVVQEASPTRLVVQTPNLPNEALRVRVAVVGAQDYSNAVPLPLTAAFVRFGDLGQTEIPYGIATDEDGTLYVSLERDGASVGIVEIAPDGSQSAFFASTFPWTALAWGNDRLVGVRRVRAVFELPEAGAQTVLSAFQPASLLLTAIATAPNGTVYAGGSAAKIVSVAADGTPSETAFPTPIRALAAGANTLYVVGAGAGGSPDQVYTLTIASDGSLGTPAALADLPASGMSLEVAADGTLYVGLDRVVDPIVTVAPDGTVDALYPGILSGPASSLAYGTGGLLYMVRDGSGTERPDILQIETRREGAR